MFYIALKHLHLTTVAITIILFLFRSALMLWWSKGLRWRWLRILPHANDSILLLSGIGLMLLTHQYPFAQSWLTAKLVALVAYIVLGSLALKRGRTRRTRLLALVAALLCLGYLIAVARTHSWIPGLL